MTPELKNFICQTLHKNLPEILGIYAFGSRIQGTPNSDSDFDLAVLIAGYAHPLVLWELANQLANELGYEVDLWIYALQLQLYNIK